MALGARQLSNLRKSDFLIPQKRERKPDIHLTPILIRQKEKGFSLQKPHFHNTTIILLAFPLKPNLYNY
jgi:hypothetical protein